jgi:hypothetical protein
MINKNWVFFIMILFITINSTGFGQGTGEMIRQANDKFSDGNYGEAKVIAEKLISINPGLIEAHKIWVKCCKNTNHKEECIKFYQDKCNETILTFWNKNRPFWLFGLGLSYIEDSQERQAEEAFNSCIKLDPTAPIVKEITDISKKNKLNIVIPATSLSQDIKKVLMVIGGIILLLILWGAYNAYRERKAGEQQVANIKKDRTVDFFGNIRKK